MPLPVVDFFPEVIMTEYSIQEVAAKLEEILERIRAGEIVVLVEEGAGIAEIRPTQRVAKTGDPVEDALRELEEEGILSSSGGKPEGELTPIAVKPGALARFLASRD
jgi:antitoxin (DNA-binding transcriptional repressor) of toxin-antitoxin stability system